MFISRSSMLTPFVKQIKGWTNPFDKPTSEHLAVSGMKEHYCLAKRLKERYPLLNDINNSECVSLWPAIDSFQ